MTDATAFDAAERRGGQDCKVCAFLADREDRDVYTREFAKPVSVRSNTAILRVLNDNGANVSESGVKRHRSKHVA